MKILTHASERQSVRKKKFLLQSLISGTVLALVLNWLAGRLTHAKSPPRRASSGTPFEEIDAYIAEQIKRLNIPGAALAIVEGDQIVHLRGFGRTRPGGEPPSPQTPFFIGSLTKSFTALAVMQLVEAGKVELDAPVQCYLPWFRVADPQASAQITVRHLLNQTSGLPMLPGMINLANFDSRPDATERQARALSTLVLAHPVGSVCEYCNLNYDLLGLITEAVSGEAYADYIQNHIFTPLGMSHSYTSKAAAKQNGLAVGHRYWFGVPIAAPNLPVPRGSLPSGQLISTVEDMAYYLIAHLNRGRFLDMQILSEAGINELHHGVVEYIKWGVSSVRYGMGWLITDTGQTKTLSHGGNVPDFSAYMGLLPEQKKGMVLLVNADHYGLPPILAEVGWGATALLAGQQPAPIRLGFIPWAMRSLPLIPLLQIAGAAATLRLIRRWRRDPALSPNKGRTWGQHILLPLIPNLSIAVIPVFLLARGMLPYLRLFMPDVYWTTLISGGFAGIWTFLRTGLILGNLRKAP
jgi:CubicO group peptidase (beta-lactamase class C family)